MAYQSERAFGDGRPWLTPQTDTAVGVGFRHCKEAKAEYCFLFPRESVGFLPNNCRVLTKTESGTL
jgi:hypothetical protein